MEAPQLTTIHGAYVYLMGSLLALAGLLGIYFLAVAAGMVPGPAPVTGAIAVA